MFPKFQSIFFVFIVSVNISTAQDEVIHLVNPSFEDIPHGGVTAYPNQITGWKDCGSINFRGETPPDIHNSLNKDAIDNLDQTIFGVTKMASQGQTFLGMVARDNETYESVSQRLEFPLIGNQCYTFSIDLCQSKTYISPFPAEANSKSYTKPIVMRIYGGSSLCNKRELLAESDLVNNSEWKTFNFTFSPTLTHRYITLEAFYKTPIVFPYNGNLLVDNASAIIPTLCPEELIAMAEAEAKKVTAEVPNPKKEEPKTKPTPKKEEPKTKPTPKKEEPKVEIKQPVMVINKDLDRTKIKEGQIINIKNLYFEADQAQLGDKSYNSLDELVAFLKSNKGVKVEIGGHTNGQPTHEWCDSLSRERALSVANYLFRKDIPRAQVEYKGYGKRQPIASNETKAGRARNQRVEIKILKLDS